MVCLRLVCEVRCVVYFVPLAVEVFAIMTGGKVFDKQKGMKLDKFSWDWFGEARKVTVTKEQTTIVDGKGELEAIEARVEELQSQIEKAKTPYETEQRPIRNLLSNKN